MLIIVQNNGCLELWERSDMYSIPEAMWMVLATLTTVGFGDIYPHTPAGLAFTSLVMYLGIVVLALPIMVISSNFEGNWRRFKR
jgi:Ion channel